MLPLLVTIGCALASSVLVLWTTGQFIPRRRLSWTIAGGTVAGHVAWTAMNELAAADPSSGVGSVIRSTIATFATPREAGQWIVIVLLVAGAGELLSRDVRQPKVDATDSPRSWSRVWNGLIWGFIYAGALLRLLWGSVYFTREWSVAVAGGIVAGHVLVLLSIAALDRQTVRPRIQAMRLSLMTLAIAAASVVIGMSGSAVYAQLTLTAVASLCVCSWFAWRQPPAAERQFIPMGMILLVVGYQLWLSHFFAELKLVDGGLLMASLAASSMYGWGSDSRATWLTRVLPATATIAFSLMAVTHAGITLAQALANPAGY